MSSNLTAEEIQELTSNNKSVQNTTTEQLLLAAGFGALKESSFVDDIGAALRQLVFIAKDQDSLGRAGLREAVIRRLKSIGVSSPAGLADAAFGDVLPERDSKPQGTAINFADPDPWPESVNMSIFLNDLVNHFKRRVILPDGAALTLALWTISTYSFDSFNVHPVLAAVSPEKRCGKTVLLEALAVVVRKPLATSNVTPAAVFRVVEEHSPTLLIDEGDTFVTENEELRGILNSGHRKSSAFVLRTVGDKLEVRQFRTWAPKVIALIGNLPDTLQDRSIEIKLRRKDSTETVERIRYESLFSEMESIRRKLMRWAVDSSERLSRMDPKIPIGLHDRAADNWRGLLAIAELASGDWLEQARNAALVLSGTTDDDGGSSVRTQLLSDLRNLFLIRSAGSIPSEDVCQALKEMEDRPWPEWKNGKPITPRQLARLLKPFGIEPRQTRNGSVNVRGYSVEDCQDAFSRYLSPLALVKTDNLSATALQSSVEVGVSRILSATLENVRSATPLQLNIEKEIRSYSSATREEEGYL
jgi:putative DNA primase/helicase